MSIMAREIGEVLARTVAGCICTPAILAPDGSSGDNDKHVTETKVGQICGECHHRMNYRVGFTDTAPMKGKHIRILADEGDGDDFTEHYFERGIAQEVVNIRTGIWMVLTDDNEGYILQMRGVYVGNKKLDSFVGFLEGNVYEGMLIVQTTPIILKAVHSNGDFVISRLKGERGIKIEAVNVVPETNIVEVTIKFVASQRIVHVISVNC